MDQFVCDYRRFGDVRGLILRAGLELFNNSPDGPRLSFCDACAPSTRGLMKYNAK